MLRTPPSMVLMTIVAWTLSCGGETGSTATSGTADGSQSSEPTQPSKSSAQCNWPAYLDDGGPGTCTVGRAFVECQYPVGVVCEGGPSASGGGEGPSGPVSGLTQLCISSDPTSCSGCSSSTGTATCTNKCAPTQYAVSCGGPPVPSLPDGGQVTWTYQNPPEGCVGVGGTPGGNGYYCCPCQ